MKLLDLIKSHPLRFTGYVSLAAGIVFAGTLLFTTLADPENERSSLNSWLELITGGILVLAAITFFVGIVVGVFRNSWRKSLKRLGWFVLWFVTLVALLVAFENWRGRRAWKAYVEELKAVGDDPRMEAVIPVPVPDDQNVAMAPLFLGILDYDRATNPKSHTPVVDGGVLSLNEDIRWVHTNAINRLSNLRVLPEKSPKSNGGWRAGRLTDLAAWQASYRASTNFPSRSEPSSPSEDILYALAGADPVLALLREAAARPHSVFPVKYDETINALLPHLGYLKKLSQLAQMRALAELAEGRIEDAATDTFLALRLSEFMAQEPFLISQLVRIAQLDIAMGPVWEGLSRHQWADHQLARFDSHLARMDFVADFQLAMRGERNIGTFGGLDMMRDRPGLYASIIAGDPSLNAIRFMPGAFMDQSKVANGRLFAKALKTSDPAQRRFFPHVPEKLDRELDAARPTLWRKPYQILASLLMPALTKSSLTFARAQTTVDLARVAIALERHRLKHGAYPATLEALDAALVPAGGIPRDVISGGPLHYAPTADGRFQLYAVGWNSKDDGGSVVWKDKAETQVDFTQGDWVWPQPRE